MAAPDGLEARVAALETQVAELSEKVRHTAHDAAAARVLAGGADRDVTEIRAEIRDFRQATTGSFNAMREDLNDLRGNLGDLRQETTNGFVEMRGKLDATAAGQQQIVALLNQVLGGPGESGDR
jgi:hypothetical protein